MKSTFSLSFFLKRMAARKTGGIGRITVNGKAVEFRPGLALRPEDGSVEKGRAIGRTPDVIRLNAILDAARNAVTQHYQRLLTEDGYVTAEKVRDAYLGRDEKVLKKKEEERRNNTTLLDFFDRFNLYWNGSLLFQFFPVSSFSFIGWYMQIYKILLIQKAVETSLKNKLPFPERERKLDKQPERRLFFFIFR